MKGDFIEIYNNSKLINEELLKVNIFKRVIRALLKMISPLL